MRYYLLEQDLMIPGTVGLGDVPDFIDPIDWIQGKVMPTPSTPLRLPLSPNSGDFRGDLIQSLLTLFSTKLRESMTAYGVDNVEYIPVELEHPTTGEIEPGYWLANIIGLVNCVDPIRSTFKRRAGGTGIRLKSFYVDERRAPAQPIFRLDEKATLVLVNEGLKAHLDGAELRGVRLIPTEEYEGV